MNLIWLITGEGEMLIPPDGQKKDTIYISNPDKDEIIDLQREQIQLLKEKIQALEQAHLADARLDIPQSAATHYVPTELIAKRAPRPKK